MSLTLTYISPLCIEVERRSSSKEDSLRYVVFSSYYLDLTIISSKTLHGACNNSVSNHVRFDDDRNTNNIHVSLISCLEILVCSFIVHSLIFLLLYAGYVCRKWIVLTTTVEGLGVGLKAPGQLQATARSI